MRKNYKVGDRVFYEAYPSGEICTDIVKKVEEDSYINDKGKEISCQWLVLWEDGNCSSGIENYNCLSSNNPKCRDIAKQYTKFDKQKDEIIDSIMKIISPFDNAIHKDIIKLLETKIKQNDTQRSENWSEIPLR